MIEIVKADRGRDEKARRKTAPKSGMLSSRPSAFASELASSISFDFEGPVEQLMADLKEQEREFLDKQSHYELEKYKALVKKILKIIIDEGLQTTSLKKKRRDMADYTIVNEINAKLTDMTAAVIKSNRAFNLLKTIEEIRGLILDLAS